MNYYSPAPPRFAYCYQEMMPVNMPATGEWPDHNSEAAPRPPNDWEPRGFGSGWREWRNPSGPIGRIVPRKSFLLVWHQRTQEFWVRAENGEWNTLFCQHLADNGGHSRRRPGLWRLAECGPQRQHDSQCPSGFDKFLPQNFFKNLGASSCHFVGHLSLILALVAMCPENADAIPDYIERIFYCNNQPEYRPDPNISARNKWTFPGRALMMQTGAIEAYPNSSEQIIQDWENGQYGPMISSKNPKDEELQAWGLM